MIRGTVASNHEAIASSSQQQQQQSGCSFLALKIHDDGGCPDYYGVVFLASVIAGVGLIALSISSGGGPPRDVANRSFSTDC